MLSNMIIGAHDAGASIAGVLRYETTASNRFIQKIRDLFNPTHEYTLMKQLKLKDLDFKSLNSGEFRKFLIKNNIDILFVGTWKERIEKQTFDMPVIGAVNIHPSLLPKYRGPNPYIQTILHGEEFSGVTLHLIDEGYDTGAILYQEKIKIKPEDTSKELKERTVVVARSLVTKFLNELNTGIITPIAQINSKSSYYKNITGEEKMLNFGEQTAVEIYRTVKALHPFLPSYITHGRKFFVVNPYKIKILDKSYPEHEAGTITEKSEKTRALTIVCKDKRAIRFYGLELYKMPLSTSRYIKQHVKISGQAG